MSVSIKTGIAEAQGPQAGRLPRRTGPAEAEAPAVGIVVPVLNEAAILAPALERLQRIAGGCAVTVVDGGSSDGSAEIARRYFPTVVAPQTNRGAQMDLGATLVAGDVLLFLHADSRLPPDFLAHIEQALRDPRVAGGCFRLRFDAPGPLLRFYAWCTRFPGRFLHFGDQAFFVRREVFARMGGYRGLPFLEDVDLLRRLKRYGRLAVLRAEVETSARRFLKRGVVWQQLVNILIVTLFELGVSPYRLARLYPHIR